LNNMALFSLRRCVTPLSTGWARFIGSTGRAAGEAAPIDVLSKIEPEAGRPLYMDLQATTPTDPRVLDAMLPYSIGAFGNPHSRTHAYGWEAEDAVEVGRKQVAELIGADARRLFSPLVQQSLTIWQSKASHGFTVPLARTTLLR